MSNEVLLDEPASGTVLQEQPIMKGENAVNFDVAQLKKQSLQKLIHDAHASPMDYMNSIPWDMGVNLTRPPKNPDHCWLFGTKYFDGLNSEQKLEILWLQIAHEFRNFIRLEQIIPVVYMGYIAKYQHELPRDIYEFLLVFSKEEIVHTIVFKKFLELCDLDKFETVQDDGQLLQLLLGLSPVMGVLFTLLTEWVAEQIAMYSTQEDLVDPLTRELFRLHHIDESRHIAFGRWVIESHVSQASVEEIASLRVFTRDTMAWFVPASSYNPEIALHTSFTFPVGCGEDSAAAIQEIRNSEAIKNLNLKRFSPIYTWLEKIGLSCNG